MRCYRFQEIFIKIFFSENLAMSTTGCHSKVKIKSMVKILRKSKRWAEDLLGLYFDKPETYFHH